MSIPPFGQIGIDCLFMASLFVNLRGYGFRGFNLDFGFETISILLQFYTVTYSPAETKSKAS
jgi:hypothetical protein